MITTDPLPPIPGTPLSPEDTIDRQKPSIKERIGFTLEFINGLDSSNSEQMFNAVEGIFRGLVNSFHPQAGDIVNQLDAICKRRYLDYLIKTSIAKPEDLYSLALEGKIPANYEEIVGTQHNQIGFSLPGEPKQVVAREVPPMPKFDCIIDDITEPENISNEELIAYTRLIIDQLDGSNPNRLSSIVFNLQAKLIRDSYRNASGIINEIALLQKTKRMQFLEKHGFTDEITMRLELQKDRIVNTEPLTVANQQNTIGFGTQNVM